MDIGDIISAAFKYPIKGKGIFANAVVLFSLFAAAFSINYLILIGVFAAPLNIRFLITFIGIVLGVILVIPFYLMLPGYSVSVMREGIKQSGVIPKIKIGKNIGDTFRLLALSIVYMIIPVLILVVITVIMGFSISNPNSNMAGILLLILAYFVVAIISLVFGFILMVAVMRFAKTGSVKEGLAFSKVFDDIKQIGILKLVGTYIILGIIVGIGMLIMSLLKIIPYFGMVISVLTISPFILLFYNYALGLLYSDIA